MAFQQRERKLVKFEDTKFIFMTNFSGDPARDNFGNSSRKVNIIIPSYEQAQAMIAEGLNVKETKPRPGDEEGFIPDYYIVLYIGYRNRYNEPVKNPPRIYIVSGNSAVPVLLDENSVGDLDHIFIKNVKCVASIYENPVTGKKTLYVRTMYVEQDFDDDPFAADYVKGAVVEEDDDLPF